MSKTIYRLLPQGQFPIYNYHDAANFAVEVARGMNIAVCVIFNNVIFKADQNTTKEDLRDFYKSYSIDDKYEPDYSDVYLEVNSFESGSTYINDVLQWLLKMRTTSGDINVCAFFSQVLIPVTKSSTYEELLDFFNTEVQKPRQDHLVKTLLFDTN